MKINKNCTVVWNLTRKKNQNKNKLALYKFQTEVIAASTKSFS